MNQIQIISLIIFCVTYIGIIFTRLPCVNIDRPSAAFFGAVAMIVFGVLTFNEAINSIDFNTIALLLGMMLVISSLQLDVFFSLIAIKTISFAKTRFKFLVIVVFITGISSAFLVNDAVVLLFTPVIITICINAQINPMPYLIAEILSSNAGSVMTITGNPQNMLIGINSQISFTNFLIHLMPIAIVSMVFIIFIIRIYYKKEFLNKSNVTFQTNEFKYKWKDMKFSIPIFILLIVGFFLSKHIGFSIPLVALIGGALILLLGKVKPSKVIKQVDWVLLLFFAALFIVVHGLEKVGIIDLILNKINVDGNFNGIAAIHGISLFFSQIVSNVPLTVLMLPLMKLANNNLLWLSLASASTLAGNATIIGAMANLIVIESAKNYQIEIKFLEFLKPGLLLTLISLIFSMLVFYLYILFL